ncbi:MAG: hypothetical protein AAGD25_41040, partial [Cyanobacteria bacterium P01_F01_bin.150]
TLLKNCVATFSFLKLLVIKRWLPPLVSKFDRVGGARAPPTTRLKLIPSKIKVLCCWREAGTHLVLASRRLYLTLYVYRKKFVP